MCYCIAVDQLTTIAVMVDRADISPRGSGDRRNDTAGVKVHVLPVHYRCLYWLCRWEVCGSGGLVRCQYCSAMYQCDYIIDIYIYIYYY